MPVKQVASLFRKVRAATRRPRTARRPRLLLEQLEDRLTPSTLIPVSNPRDLVFDATRNQLDITTAGGQVQRWNVASQALLPATNVGTSLFGADITPDGASLYAADGQVSNGQAVVHQVNLANGTVSGLPYGVSGAEAGSFAIALGGNGKALFDGQSSGPGGVPLRQIDLTSGTLSTRTDDPGSVGGGLVRPDTMIYRGADRSLFFFTEPGNPSGPIFDYDATAGTWSKAVNTGAPLDNAPAAVNRNGTLIALEVGGNLTVMDRTLSPVKTLTGVTGALEFDPASDLLYVANGSAVTAYNTGTWAAQFSLPVGESVGTPSAFGNGAMAVSADDKFLFVATPTGVRELGLPAGDQLVVSGFPASTTAGAGGSITVTVEDAGGHALTGYTGTVHFTSTDPQAVLPADYTFTGADAGAHTFTGVVLKTAGAQSVSVTDNGSPPLTGGETNIAVSPAAASSLALSGLPMATTAGTPVSVTVTARDPYGNVATGYRGTAHFTSTDLQAVLPAGYTFTSADAGAHTFNNGVTPKTAGGQSVTASDGTFQNTANTTVVAGAASQLVLTAQPPGMVAPGGAFGLAVTVEDASGNVVTTFTGSVSIGLPSNPGGATLGGSTTTNAVNGVATFTGLTLDKPGIGYKLQATSTGLSAATTAAFDVDSLSLSGGSVPEFRPVGTAVGTFSTTPGTGHTFTYTLVSGAGSADNGSFTLSGNQLLTADAFNAGAKSSYSVRVRTTDERGLFIEQPITVTITNDPALALSNGTLTVTGTPGNDAFTFTPGAAQDSMTLNGKALAVDAAAVSSGGVVFNGNGGSDSATLTAGGGANTLSLSPGGGTLSGPGYQVTLNKVGQVVATGHAGDRAYLTGSPGADAFVGTPTYAYLYDTASGASFFNQANGFGVVVASGGGGGTAYLYGDARAGGNVFVATPTYAYLRGHSSGFFNQVSGFRAVVGTAAAGSDQSYLYGGGGSTFVGTPSYAYLYGSGPWEQANGFQFVVGHASGTGNTAYQYGTSAGGNTLVVTPTYSYLTGPAGAGRTGHFINYADGFQTVVGVAGSAHDGAYLYGVPGNTLVATSAYAALSGTGLSAQASGFASVQVYSGGGGQAYLHGTMTAADTFVEGSGSAYLYGATFLDFASGFASVWANPLARR
jgi:hypothetical protein